MPIDENLKDDLLKAIKADKDFKPKHGVQGIPGEKGDRGDKGERGEPGPVGSRGIQGAPGDRGPIGQTGPRGGDGGPGRDGGMGPQGPVGPRGINGTDGPRGYQGNQGPQGNQGARGPQGEPGTPGVSGANYSCRAFCKEPFTVNAGEWTTVYFGGDNWDTLGNFHSTASNTQFLCVNMQGTYRIEAVVEGATKIRIVHITEDGRETVVARRNGDACSTKWICRRFEKFRVDVFCENTWGVNPDMASPVFIITKEDRVG